MFGSSAFGAPSTPAFGSSTFGSTTSTFGQQSTPFGGTSTFGAGSSFGAPAAATTGFGGFGAPATPATSTPFGFGSTPSAFGSSTGAFGAPATPSPFGAPAATTASPFGAPASTSLFGAPAATPSPFGAPAATTPSPFGAPATSAFGSATPFGSTPSPFGAPAAASPFGAPAASSPFGAPATGGFGMSTSQGTGNPPYKHTVENDPSGPQNHMAITAMQAYSQKCFEELRWEDYQKKAGGAAPATGGLFGATPAASPFGSTPATSSPFGAPAASSSIFGAPAATASPFGAPATASPFGAPAATASPFGAPATSSPFGAPAATASPFGAPATSSPFGAPAATASPFGAPAATASPFGAPSTGTSLFGSTPAATPSPFGAPSTGSAFSFGATPSATSSPFGAPAATPSPFGAPAAASTSLFGAPAASSTPSFSFGGAPSAFGASTAPAATSSLFGAPASGGLFGAPAAATPSSFGNPASTPSFSFGGAPAATSSPFGAPAAGGSLFGGAPAASSTPSFSFSAAPSTSSFGGFGAAPSSFGSFGAAPLAGPVKQASLTAQPFGVMTTMPNLNSTSTSTLAPAPAVTPKKQPTVSHYKLTPRSTNKVKPRGYGRPHTPLFEDNISLNPETFVSRDENLKRLVIEDNDDDTVPMGKSNTSFFGSPAVNRTNGTNVSTDTINLNFTPNQNRSMNTPESGRKFQDEIKLNVSQDDVSVLPKLTKSDYYTIPDLNKLATMDPAALSAVENFIVGKLNVGSVRFLTPTDIRNLNLDEIVEFNPAEIEVYPDRIRNKPAVGQGLNKPAVVLLNGVYPKVKGGIRDDPQSLAKFEQRLKSVCEKSGSKFRSYDRNTGDWSFEVAHFSRYGLLDDDEDDEEVPEPVNQMSISQLPQNVAPTTSSGHFKANLNLEEDQDEDMYSENQKYFDDSQDEINLEVEDQDEIYASEAMGTDLGLDKPKMQVMKSFLFSDDQVRNEFSPEFQSPKAFGSTSPISGTPLIFETPRSRNRFQDDDDVISTPADIRSRRIISVRQNRRFTTDPIPGQTLALTLPKPVPRADLPDEDVDFDPALLIRKVAPQVALATSLMKGKEAVRSDMSLFMGRSFRVSWGPNGMLYHSVIPISSTSISNSPRNFGQISVEKVTVVPAIFGKRDETYLPMLKNHLLCSRHFQVENDDMDDMSVPVQDETPHFQLENVQANIEMNTDIKYQESESFNGEFNVKTFKLIEALFGAKFNSEIVFPGIPVTATSQMMARYHSLSEWLIDDTSVDQAMLQLGDASEETTEISLKKIIEYLSARDINAAVELAVKIKDFRLATLIAQSVMNLSLREDLIQQIQSWKEDQLWETFSPEHKKIYQLLSGDLTDIVGNFDWHRAFAMCLWYASNPKQRSEFSTFNLNIREGEGVLVASALFQLEKLIQKHLVSPVPNFLSDRVFHLRDLVGLATSCIDEKGGIHVWKGRNRISNQLAGDFDIVSSDVDRKRQWQSVAPVTSDIHFQILRLFSNRSFPMVHVLNPAGVSPFSMDFHLVFHVYTVLMSLQLFPRPEDLHQICTSYAFQLEIIGMWTWSIYVLSHLPRKFPGKFAAIREILTRHAHEMTLENQEFLEKKLFVPKSWIQLAKSWLEKSRGNFISQVELLKGSNEWESLHQLILKELAPQAILRGTLKDMESLLEEMEGKNVIDWEIGAGMLLQYIRIKRATHSLARDITSQQSVLDLASSILEGLQIVGRHLTTLLKKLGSGISEMQNVAFSDISVDIGQCIINMEKTMGDISMSHVSQYAKISSTLRDLPIPDDYRLIELNSLQNMLMQHTMHLHGVETM